MARGVNKVILIGNAGADPEQRFTTSGAAVANLNIATTDQWKDRQTGQRQERTEWHRLVFFNGLSEVVGRYVTRGTRLYVEGRLQTRKWQNQNGEDRYTTEIVVNEMNIVGGGRQDNTQHGGNQGHQGQHGAPAAQQPGNQGHQGQYGAPAAHQTGNQGKGAPGSQPVNNGGHPNNEGDQASRNYGAPEPGSYGDPDDDIPF